MKVKSKSQFFCVLGVLFSIVCLGTQVQADTINPDAWVAIPQTTQPSMENLSIPANAASRGMWSGVHGWPMNGLHSALLPDGRVLTFGSTPDGSSQNGRYLDVWDPALGFGPGAHLTVYDASRQDSFCAAAVYLSDGSLMISGGNGSSTSTLYDAGSHSSYTSSASMAAARWYATMINLPDGRPIILGGMVPYTEDMVNQPDQAIANGWPSMTPEVFENGQWRSLFGAYSRIAFGPDYLRTSYPRSWVAPDGRVFGISAEQMWYLDPDANGGNGAVVSAGVFKGPYRYDAPVNVGATNSAVMYAPGKILQVGGNGSFNGDELPASNMATVIDINGPAPVLSEQPAMSYPRRYPNAIVLADGNVVITGGATYGNYNNGQPASAVYAAEIWNPETGSWSIGADAARYRGYHSITTLLTDGTILSTGGGTPGPVTNLNAEIYYPPYLFRSVNGVSQLAPRPVMVAISGLSYANGAPMQIDMASSQPVSQLTMVGISSGTHSFNSGQRRIPLTFSQDRFRLTATLPGNTIAPPGYYQVVALDANGTPSIGVIVAIGQDQAAPPIVPSPYTPPSLEETITTPVIGAGESVSYSISSVADTTYSWTFGDGSAATEFSPTAEITHVFNAPGVYVVTLTAKAANGATATRTFVQAVSTARTLLQPGSSMSIAIEPHVSGERIWVVNPDNDTVSVMSAATNALLAEIAVGTAPRAIAIAPDGRIWVTNKASASISIINPSTLSVAATHNLPFASQPHGLVFAPNGSAAYVVLEAGRKLLQLNPTNGTQQASVDIGPDARHVAISADSSKILVTRFVTPPLPGESTAVVDTANAGAEMQVIDPVTMTIVKTTLLRHSDKADNEIQGSGIPNYLGGPAISPDGGSAWIPSKQDNIKRGVLRNGLSLDFQNTVRAISSRVDMITLEEEYPLRVDHDNSGVGSAAAFHPNGVYLFVTLETSREVAVVNAINGSELFRVKVGIAPQGVAVSADGLRLYVKNFIGRSISVVNLEPLLNTGTLTATLAAVVKTVLNEKFNANVLKGKEFFYDAANPKLARDSYMSCASCHSDGSQDGRVWDLTGFGEGLRNTVALNGRGGIGHGLLHWSGNFDEVQDFEKQIRDLAGGSGLMADVDYLAGTRSQPLGDSKTGISSELDQLAAYLSSLKTFAPSVYRNSDGTLTTAAVAGKTVFFNSCASCHGGNRFTLSSDSSALQNVGTINGATGQRLGAPITGLDIPTLRDVWATAPYLHNGSAATISEAIQAHANTNLSNTDLANVVAYVQQIGNAEQEQNLAPDALLATSHVSPWETLAAVNNDVAPTSSADNSTGAYGNWQGEAAYGASNWVSFTWPTAKSITAFEIYWWNDGAGIDTPTVAHVDYWDGLEWKSIGPIGRTLNTYNRIELAVITTAVRVSMSSLKATGILEARVLGFEAPPNVAPTISLTAPAANASIPAGTLLTLGTNAADSDGTVTKVEFYAGATLLGTDTDAPYSFNWTPATAGTYSITAKAYDNRGAVTTSSAITITVTAPVNVAPTVVLTSPSSNATVYRYWSVALRANASDSDGRVTKVEFYANTTRLGTDTTAAYSYNWRPTSRGTYVITARAYDNSGKVTTSNAVTLTVR